jgi:hypothetical protein
MRESPEELRAQNGQPAGMGEAGLGASCAEGGFPAKDPAVSGRGEGHAGGPRLVFRDGVAYVEGCDVPIWRLEMGRRAGSSPEATLAVSPGLTPEGLELAFAYAQEHKAEFDPLIQYHSGADVPLEDEGDDEDDAAYEAELDAFLIEHAEVLRRLAQ